MKKVKLVAKVFGGLFLLYGALGFFVLPSLIKNQIIENAEPLLKRHIQMDELSFNPYSFTLELEGMKIQKEGSNKALFSLRKLYVDVDPTYLLFSEIHISKLELSGPEVFVHKQNDGRFNFSDLLVSQEDNSSTKKAPLPNISVGKFAIRSGVLDLIDETENKTFKQVLKPINFTLRDFSTSSDGANALSLYVEVDDGAYVDYKGEIASLEPLQLKGSLNLHSGRLYTQWKYVQDMLGFVVADGALDAYMEYSADFSNTPAQININKYQLQIHRLRLQEKGSKENILRLPSLDINGSADISKQLITVDNFKMKELSLKASRDEQGMINWVSYLPKSEGEKVDENATPSTPWDVYVQNTHISMKDVSYEEHYVQEPHKSILKTLDFKMDNLHLNAEGLNLPAIRLDLQGLSTQELARKQTIFEMDTFALHAKLSQNEANVSGIDIDGIKSYVQMDTTGKLSLLNYLPKSEEKNETLETNSSFSWSLERLNLNDAACYYEDNFNANNGNVNLEKMNLTLTNLRSNRRVWTNINMDMHINSDARATVQAKLRQEPLKVYADAHLTNLAFKPFQTFADKKVNMDINDGRLSLDLKAEHDEKSSKVFSNVKIHDLNLSERKEGKPFFAFSLLKVDDIEVLLNPNQMQIGQIDIYEPYARIKVDQNQSTNLSELVQQHETNTSQEAEASSQENPFPIIIGKVDLKDGKGRFSDLSLPLPFKTDVHDINGEIIALGTLQEIRSIMDIRGTVDEYGLMKVDGSVRSADPKAFTDIDVKFENIDMTNLSPYTGKFIGYKLKEGKMNIDLGYKIKDSQMQGANKIVLTRMNLGDEVESENAISAPVGLAIALLKDSDGVIDLDVPVSGNVDEPEFEIGKVVWTAFKNLIVGVATAPFRFLADALGMSEEALENIGFEEAKADLLPPQKETLDALSKVLKEKPALNLAVMGQYDLKRDRLKIKTEKMLEEALRELDDKSAKLSTLDKRSLTELLEGLYLKHFDKTALESLEKQNKNENVSEEEQTLQYNQALKQALIERQEVSMEELEQLAMRRAQAIIKYLISQEVAGERLSLKKVEGVQVEVQENEYVPSKLELGT